jgi:heat shock protein HslJ
MACDPGAMQVESAFLSALARPLRWRMQGPMLVLESAGNSLTLVPAFEDSR